PFGTYNGGFWVVTRYADVVEIEQDPATFSSVPGAFLPLANQDRAGPMSKHILFMDPPVHTRVRKVAARAFGPRVIAQFETWIREIVVETLDDALPLGEFDWVEQVARLIPARVVARVMGVPHEDRDSILRWSDDIFNGQARSEDGSVMARAFEAVGSYMSELGRRKLAQPADDVVSLLAQSLDRGDLDQAEYLMYTTALLIAGYETTHTLIGQSTRLLIEDAAARELTQRAIAASKQREVVDELLRLVTPAMNIARTAVRDVEFHGQRIRANDTVMLLLNAANRDPAAFDDPHRFDPFRAGVRSHGYGRDGLAFGSGIHRCVGAMLAKLELRILLEEMDRRGTWPQLAGEPRRGWSALVNQLLSLPVRVA
ncbi:MAG TPA: cytochrome P450, partial [Pseudonocardia sp.]